MSGAVWQAVVVPPGPKLTIASNGAWWPGTRTGTVVVFISRATARTSETGRFCTIVVLGPSLAGPVGVVGVDVVPCGEVVVVVAVEVVGAVSVVLLAPPGEVLLGPPDEVVGAVGGVVEVAPPPGVEVVSSTSWECQPAPEGQKAIGVAAPAGTEAYRASYWSRLVLGSTATEESSAETAETEVDLGIRAMTAAMAVAREPSVITAPFRLVSALSAEVGWDGFAARALGALVPPARLRRDWRLRGPREVIPGDPA